MAVDSIQAVSAFSGSREFPDPTPLFKGPAAPENDRNADQTEEKRRVQKRADYKEPQHTPAGLSDDMEEFHKALDQLNVRLAFSVDKDSGEMVVRIVDGKSGEVVRQIPSEEKLKLMTHIRKKLDAWMEKKDLAVGTEERLARRSGLLVDEKA